jgi:hypothetical protein
LPSPGRADAVDRVARRRRRHPGRQRRGHDAVLGRRYRVALPTASTTAPGDLRSVIRSESVAGSVCNQERPTSGPPTGATSPPAVAPETAARHTIWRWQVCLSVNADKKSVK